MSIPSDGLSDEEIKEILEKFKVVAVVGMSKDPMKPGHYVPKFLLRQGYKIIPVNPTIDEVLGLKSYPNLLEISEDVDIVNVFRRPEHTPEIAEEAVKKRAKVLWLQEGIYSQQAVEIAKKGGLTVVWNRCMMKEHSRLIGSKPYTTLRRL
ncbi:MAG: CoA-binding protein [Aigarchaeota archaeon]|nr:CoA-binding protein [Aigarchaeota archaeon]MCX8192300.1 CoA-binding protein [Nitrososphaeria archaeon]MDW7986092.1 CoA-binding protein [Nitrososphaerota archaeon]